MREGRGKTISMNDEISAVYEVSEGNKKAIRPETSGRFVLNQLMI